MKKILMLLIPLSLNAYGSIENSSYILKKIVCSDGKELKIGGKFMQYSVELEFNSAQIKMKAHAKSAQWAPFKLDCTQINTGKYSLSGENEYSGYLSLESVQCNASAWEAILKKQLFGVEEEGVFTFEKNGKSLKIFNKDTITKYSCKKTNSFPIYHYEQK